jgi:hypothetical protein
MQLDGLDQVWRELQADFRESEKTALELFPDPKTGDGGNEDGTTIEDALESRRAHVAEVRASGALSSFAEDARASHQAGHHLRVER